MLAIYGILIMLTVIGLLFGLCLIGSWIEKKFPSRNYDERQNQERGKAYRFSTWVGLIYFFTVAVAQLNGLAVANYLVTMAGVMLMLAAFLIYGMLKGCYLTLTQRPLGNAFFFLLMGGTQLYNCYLNIRLYSLSLTGRGAFGWVVLMMAVLYTVAGVGYLILALPRDRD